MPKTFEKNAVIGSWTLLEPVARDLSAPLWIAEDGKQVAYVRSFRVRDPRLHERLQQLGQWAQGYDHNNIVPLIEVLQAEGGVAVVSRYEEGQMLATVLGKARLSRRPVPVDIAVGLALDMLDGLHALGGRLAPAWSYGGLRPECILYTRGGRARIMEVGVAGALAAVEPLSKEPSWAAYAAPEEVERNKPEANSDVFTVGALLWEMLAGRRLFDGRSFAAVKKGLAGTVDPVDKHASGVSRALADAIAQALRQDAAERFDGASAFAGALREAAGAPAERAAISEFLEKLHVVQMDMRRRSLSQKTGREAPVSIPPAAGARPRPMIGLQAPPVPRIEVPRIRTQPPPPAEPAKPKPEPRKAASTPPEPKKPASMEPPPEKPASLPPAPDAPPAEPKPASRPPLESDLDWEAEPQRTSEAIPLSSQAPEALPLSKPPPDDTPEVGVSQEDAAPASQGDLDIPIDASLPHSAASVAGDDDLPVDMDISPSSALERPSVRPSAAPAPAPEPEPEPEPPPAPEPEPEPPPVRKIKSFPAPAPAEDLSALLDTPSIPPPTPVRRFPWFFLGLLAGCGATLVGVYGIPGAVRPVFPPPAGAMPAPPPAPTPAPTTTETVADTTTDTMDEPEPEPSASAATSASASASASAAAPPKPAPIRPRPRPKGDGPYDEVWVVPAPK